MPLSDADLLPVLSKLDPHTQFEPLAVAALAASLGRRLEDARIVTDPITGLQLTFEGRWSFRAVGAAPATHADLRRRRFPRWTLAAVELVDGVVELTLRSGRRRVLVSADALRIPATTP